MTGRRGPGPGGACPIRLLPLLPLCLLIAAAPAPVDPPAGNALPDAVAMPPAVSAAALALIDQSLAEDRLDDAESLISRTRSRIASPELQLRAAELILARGDAAGAATAFAALHDIAEVSARAWQGSGIAALKRGQLVAAATALDTAVAQDPGLARAWNARGVVADRQRDWKRAEAAYARAVAADPAFVPALNNRGYSLLLQRRFAEAEADLAKAVAREPGLAAARTNLRLARAMQGKYEEAFVGSTREGLAADLNTVGFAAMARGDDATAEVYFNRAMAVNSRYDRTAAANLDYLKRKSAEAATDGGPR
jgi:Flp pilus assembly protein TadD